MFSFLWGKDSIISPGRQQIKTMPLLIISIINRNILIHNNLTTGHKKNNRNEKHNRRCSCSAARAYPRGEHSVGLRKLSVEEIRHSGYFPWIHGKFICKGEGKWSCPGLRSYRSYGSEAAGWPYELLWSVSLSMIFYYHLFIGEVRTIRNETTYSIHGKYPLNQVRNLRNLNHLIIYAR